MEVIAHTRHLRMSPRKVRLVIDVIRGKNVAIAASQLTFMKKAAAIPVYKLLQSAVANAEHNFHLDTSGLFVKKITADGGPVLHRWTPKAFGRSAPIRKRTSHITIVLASRDDVPVNEKKTMKPAPTKKAPVSRTASTDTKAAAPKKVRAASKK